MGRVKREDVLGIYVDGGNRLLCIKCCKDWPDGLEEKDLLTRQYVEAHDDEMFFCDESGCLIR